MEQTHPFYLSILSQSDTLNIRTTYALEIQIPFKFIFIIKSFGILFQNHPQGNMKIYRHDITYTTESTKIVDSSGIWTRTFGIPLSWAAASTGKQCANLSI